MILTNSLPAFASLVTKCLEIMDMPIRIASARCLVFLQEMLNEVGNDDNHDNHDNNQ